VLPVPSHIVSTGITSFFRIPIIFWAVFISFNLKMSMSKMMYVVQL